MIVALNIFAFMEFIGVLYHYILKDKHPILEPDLIEWGMWFRTADRIVAVTEINGIRVSTVFVGLDHSFGCGEPILFETMVFGGECDGDCDRYATWLEAELGHRAAVNRLFCTMVQASTSKDD